jgi:hypothetical protein
LRFLGCGDNAGPSTRPADSLRMTALLLKKLITRDSSKVCGGRETPATAGREAGATAPEGGDTAREGVATTEEGGAIALEGGVQPRRLGLKPSRLALLRCLGSVLICWNGVPVQIPVCLFVGLEAKEFFALPRQEPGVVGNHDCNISFSWEAVSYANEFIWGNREFFIHVELVVVPIGSKHARLECWNKSRVEWPLPYLPKR